MSDETVNDNPESQATGSSERVGFCQDCGRPLTRETVRTVGSGVFCEPCLEARLAGGAAVPPPYGAAGSVGPVPVGGNVPLPPLGGNNPSPMLAGLLGLIPGVGAMYNGQYAKGFAHLVIFMLLCAMGGVNGVGWLFVLCSIGWVFYQSFEAYHTAKARREGLPLPDPFGLNNIGSQVGTQFRATAAGMPQNPYANWSGNPPPRGGTVPAPETGVPPTAAWGSVPVQAAAGPYAPYAPYAAPPAPVWTPPPSDQPGQEWANAPGYPATPVYEAPVYPVPPVRRNTVPAAAAWLIGLGVVFMVFNFMPEWRFSVHKVFPFLLMMFAIWLFVRRMFASGGLAPMEDEGAAYSTRAVCFLRMPVLLFTVSVLWVLEEFHVARFGQTWPVLVIVLGLLLLLERSVGSRVIPVVAAVPPVDASVASDGKGI